MTKSKPVPKSKRAAMLPEYGWVVVCAATGRQFTTALPKHRWASGCIHRGLYYGKPAYVQRVVIQEVSNG